MMDRRPQDSMKSTWRADKTQWRFPHKFLLFIDAFHSHPGDEVPVHAKTDKIPYMTEWSVHLWILLHAAWPMALQQMYISYTGHDLHWLAVFLLYTSAMQINSIHEVRLLARLGCKYGYLDGDKHARDEVPDIGVAKTLTSLELTTSVRPMIAIFFAFQRNATGLQLSPWLVVELALYGVVLDGFFYLYHRSCHEVDSLWQYHRTHHLTKHPNPLLSSYADSEQELLEIALIPLATWAVLKYAFHLPMTFHDWWICHEYIIFAEAYGHSGLRIYSHVPSFASPFLKYFGMELIIEDHDLHHRKGWRKSHNYGKQTRFWDTLFGTCGKRIEVTEETVDMNYTFNMPLY